MENNLVELISETYHEAGYVVRDEINRSNFSDMSVRTISNATGKELKFVDDLASMLNVPKSHTIKMVSAYNVSGIYIGSIETAKALCDEKGIYPETRRPEHEICSIGFSRKDGKWYGWSHRAIYGFKVGDKVEKGDCCATSGWTDEYLVDHPEEDMSLPVGFEAKTIEDTRKMAVAFAESVS